MKCPNCGADIPDDSEFCQHCGGKIILPPYNEKSKNSTSLILKITAISGFVLAAIMLILYLGSLNQIKELKSKAKENDTKISEVNKKYNYLKEDYDSLKDDYDDLDQQYDDLLDEYWDYRSDGQAYIPHD